MNNITLFETFKFQNGEEFQNFVNSINKEQSIYLLSQAVNHAYSKGVFNLSESEIISKSIRLIYMPTKEEPKKD